MKYKVGDNVKIIAGDQKGSSGKIVKIYRAKNKALVEGINMVKTVSYTHLTLPTKRIV